MAPVCTAWMWGLAMFIEVPRLLERGDQRVLAERWYVFLGAAVLGFAVNVASFLVINRAVTKRRDKYFRHFDFKSPD